MDARDFYNKNKHVSWTIPEIPLHLSNDYEIAKWILNESSIGWIELDIKFDTHEWKKESQAAKFVDHRGNNHLDGIVPAYTELMLIKLVHGQIMDTQTKKMFHIDGRV